MGLINYWSFRFSVLLFQLVPFWLLYFLSDVLSWQLYHIFRYRRKVVEQQLHNSFPQASEAQIQEWTRKSYHNLADIILESMKGFTMSTEQIMSRMNYKNTALLDKYRAKGQSFLLVAPHFCNWEWGVITLPLVLPHKTIGFYKPLSNISIENYTAQKRSRLGMQLAPTKTTAITFEQYKDQAACYIMMADQNPPSMQKSYWVNFLNQESACVIGPEKYARQYQLPIVLLRGRRTGRGNYDIVFTELINPPYDTLAEGNITEVMMYEFEGVIAEQIPNWLWTHRRWKKKPPIA